jgi:hypothetical protein
MIEEHQTFGDVVEEYSSNAALLIIGFHEDFVKHKRLSFFTEFKGVGDILFVNTSQPKEIG